MEAYINTSGTVYIFWTARIAEFMLAALSAVFLSKLVPIREKAQNGLIAVIASLAVFSLEIPEIYSGLFHLPVPANFYSYLLVYLGIDYISLTILFWMLYSMYKSKKIKDITEMLLLGALFFKQNNAFTILAYGILLVLYFFQMLKDVKD